MCLAKKKKKKKKKKEKRKGKKEKKEVVFSNAFIREFIHRLTDIR